MNRNEIRHARYLLNRRYGVRNADTMPVEAVIKEIERNPLLRLYRRYLNINGQRFRMAVGSPFKTKMEADYYAQNISWYGFQVHVTQADNNGAWLVYARRVSTGNQVGVICTGCQRRGTAFKSQIDEKGYVTKGMTLGCPKCGSNMKKYSPWW
jgi:hypothetical protein